MSTPPMGQRSAELRDFKVLEGELRQRIELSDGTVLEVRPQIMSVIRNGTDPGTGLPTYAMGFAPFFRVVSVGPGTRKTVDPAVGSA